MSFPFRYLAKWEASFDHKSTRKQDFHVTSETVVQVPMMRREGHYYYFLDRSLSCKVVGVPYQGNATAFFILPSEGRMGQLENGLNEKTLRKWLKMFAKRYSAGHVGPARPCTLPGTHHRGGKVSPSPGAASKPGAIA